MSRLAFHCFTNSLTANLDPGILKRIFSTIALTTALTLGGQAALAQDFDKSLTFYNNGDYATELKQWRPLAEQADVEP